MQSYVEELVFRYSMKALRAPGRNGTAPSGDATFTPEAYSAWREESLESQMTANFDVASLRGKRVLDFGCGEGALSLFALNQGAASVVGTDLSAQSIAAAEEKRRGTREHERVTFLLESDTARISLEDASVDVILCFDVLEHVMEYESIVREWKRVLAEGGKVLVWWMTWWHPYGHHLHSMVPLPWAHVFLPDRSLLRVCARIYDTPEFQPRTWHFENGQRKQNPYRGQARFGNLNKLTSWRFEAVAEKAGLEIARRKANPFTGSAFGGMKRLLAKAPWPDFFCSSMTYELRKRTNG